jgi:hypothetical protein
VDKFCCKKRDDLEEKVKRLEGNMSDVHRPADNFTFQVRTSYALLSHSAQNEWVVESGCTHHMAKDTSLFMWLDEAKERKIYVAHDFSLDVACQGDVSCQHGNIVDIYHVPNLSSNLLFVTQLTQIGEIVEFWPDRFCVRDLKKGKSIIVRGLFDLTYNLYKFHDMTRPHIEPTALVSHTYE